MLASKRCKLVKKERKWDSGKSLFAITVQKPDNKDYTHMPQSMHGFEERRRREKNTKLKAV